MSTPEGLCISVSTSELRSGNSDRRPNSGDHTRPQYSAMQRVANGVIA